MSFREERCLHVWKQKHSCRTQVTRLLSESVSFPSTLSPKELCLWCSSKVILHSKDHINKLVHYSSFRPPLQIRQTSPPPSGKICSMNYLQLLLSYIFAVGTLALWLRETPYRNLVSGLPAQANHMKFICLSHFPEFMALVLFHREGSAEVACLFCCMMWLIQWD